MNKEFMRGIVMVGAGAWIYLIYAADFDWGWPLLILGVVAWFTYDLVTWLQRERPRHPSKKHD
jgi:hypothetical protein